MPMKSWPKFVATFGRAESWRPEAVKAIATGKQELESITIDPGVVDPDDVEMLQDLVLAAVTDALTQSRDAGAKRMERVTGGMKIPGF